MASGDTLVVFTPLHNQPPSTAFATLDTRNSHPVLDFDDALNFEDAIFGGVMPRHYAGGGTTVLIVWMATTATSGNCRWQAFWERHQDDVDDLDVDSFAAVQSATVPPASISGEPQYTEITFSDGSPMDNLAVGESFRLRIRRDGDNAADTMAGDAELLRVEIRET